MPFNGTGTYTPAAAPNFPAVAGSVISSVYYNAVINDIATALTNCLTRDGQGKPSATIDWNAQILQNIAKLGVGVAAPVQIFELMSATTIMGLLYTSSATVSEFYYGTAAIKGMLGVDVAGTTIYGGTSTNHDYLFKTNNVTRMKISAAGVISEQPSGFELGYRAIPRITVAVTAAIGDRGKCNAITAGITIPNAVFTAGDALSYYNDSAASVTITQGAGLTLRLGGTANTGNRTLGLRGLCTIWFNSASEAIIQGSGVS